MEITKALGWVAQGNCECSIPGSVHAGLLPQGSSASIVCSAVEMLALRSTAAVSLTLSNWSQVCVELVQTNGACLGCWWLGATLIDAPGNHLAPALSALMCDGVPVSTVLCRFVGTARHQLLPIIFSFKLPPLCSSLTAFLPNLPICSIDEGSLSQLWFCFNVSRW